MKINTTTATAIKLLQELTDKPQTVDTLCAKIDAPYPFTQQISRKLSRAKLLKVLRGPNGGIFKADREINLYEVCEAMNLRKGNKTVPSVQSEVNKKLSEIVVA